MEEKGSRFFQYVATLTGNINMIAVGAIIGWASPVLPKLSKDPILPDNVLQRPITTEEGSWIGSLVPLGAVLGCCFSGYLGERLGRKNALLFSTFPFIVGWILVGTAKVVAQIYIGRLILGMGMTIVFTVLPMYTGEISEASIRGSLGTFLQVFISIGFLFSYVAGPYTSYLTFWLLCASLHLCFFLSFIFMPESPYFLLSKGRKSEAAQALARLRGKTVASVDEEIEKIQTEIVEAYKSKSKWRDLLNVKVNRKAVILTNMIMLFQELMGIDVVLFYVEDIFLDAGTKDPSVSAIIIGLVQLVASSVTPFFVDKYGRKVLLYISSVGCGLTIGILGVYTYLKEMQYSLDDFTWIPVVSLIIYMITYSFGWGPIPWILTGEMFAPNIKSKASSVCVFVVHFACFILTKLYPTAALLIGAYTGFWFFSICCAVNMIFIYLFLPETKCKTFMEIQQKLS